MAFAITGVAVLDRHDHWRATEGVDVVIENERIVECGPDASARRPDASPIDGRHLLLTPGFVNAHCHSPEVLARGLAADSDLSGWLSAAMDDIDALDASEIELAVHLCAVDQLRSGVTAVMDHFRQIPARLDAAESAERAWLGTGLRVSLAMMIRDGIAADGGMIDAGHAGPPPSTADIVSLCESWLGPLTLASGVVRVLGPSAPIRCTEALLAALAGLAKSRNAPLHMHVDETLEQAARARSLYDGETAVSALHRLGALSSATSLAHCVHLTDADISVLAESGATAVHCPVANLRLGSGIAPAARMMGAGTSLAIATDGAASNDSQSILEAVKTGLLVSRVRGPQERWLTVDNVLDMAFRPGRRDFMGDPDPLNGRIVPGAPADIAAFDLRDPLFIPANDLASQLALAGGALAARHVWVRGKQVLRDGLPTWVDVEALFESARAFSARRRMAA